MRGCSRCCQCAGCVKSLLLRSEVSSDKCVHGLREKNPTAMRMAKKTCSAQNWIQWDKKRARRTPYRDVLQSHELWLIYLLKKFCTGVRSCKHCWLFTSSHEMTVRFVSLSLSSSPTLPLYALRECVLLKRFCMFLNWRKRKMMDKSCIFLSRFFFCVSTIHIPHFIKFVLGSANSVHAAYLQMLGHSDSATDSIHGECETVVQL